MQQWKPPRLYCLLKLQWQTAEHNLSRNRIHVVTWVHIQFYIIASTSVKLIPLWITNLCSQWLHFSLQRLNHLNSDFLDSDIVLMREREDEVLESRRETEEGCQSGEKWHTRREWGKDSDAGRLFFYDE